MTENDLLEAVLALAQAAGYRCFHQRPARMVQREGEKQGWSSALSGSPGWPDLAICGHCRFLLVELKSDTGTLTEDQQRWRFELEYAKIEYHVWKPADWTSGKIADALGCRGNVINRRQEERRCPSKD